MGQDESVVKLFKHFLLNSLPFYLRFVRHLGLLISSLLESLPLLQKLIHLGNGIFDQICPKTNLL